MEWFRLLSCLSTRLPSSTLTEKDKAQPLWFPVAFSGTAPEPGVECFEVVKLPALHHGVDRERIDGLKILKQVQVSLEIIGAAP